MTHCTETLNSTQYKKSNLQRENTRQNYYSIEGLKEQARAYMGECGFHYTGDFPETSDEHQEKFNSEKDRKDKRSWLRAEQEYRANGVTRLTITFGRHDGLDTKYSKTFWSNSENDYTDEEREKQRKQHEEHKKRSLEKEKREEKERQNIICKLEAQFQSWKEEPPANVETYFSKRGLPNPQDTNIIRWRCQQVNDEETDWVCIVAIRDINGCFKSIQELWPEKRILPGSDIPINKKFRGKPKSGFVCFGELQNGIPIHIFEGVATAYTGFLSTRKTSVAALNAGNIKCVVEGIRNKYPESEITICADNDHHHEKQNVGIKKAEEAAIQFGCKLAVPKFSHNQLVDENKSPRTDFDDLRQLSGYEEVKRQINENSYIPEPPKKKNSFNKSDGNTLPTIEIVSGCLHKMTDKAEQILIKNKLGIYQRSGKLVRIVKSFSKPNKEIKRHPDSLIILDVNSIYLSELLGKHANWVRFDVRTQSLVSKDCPDRVSNTLLARQEWDIPILTGIIQSPTLRPDGSILEKPGYDELTGLYFDPVNTKFDPIPEKPSIDDAKKALETLRNIIKDFPFEKDEHESVAISAILTALIRKSIRTAPIHAFTAPKMGSGKSLLSDCVGLISTGKSNSVLSQSENEAEEKKRILSVLSEGDSIVCYDNIENSFGSSCLCSILTEETYKDRLLGQNRSITVPTNATFLATGNNITFVGDLSTRAIICRINAKEERPEERSFDVDLKKYIPKNRGKLVCAGLTILRAYHVAGKPKQKIKQFGRFEDWSDWIRSSLVWLGMVDPCNSRYEIEKSDPERQSLGALFEAWFKYLNNTSLRIKDAISKAKKDKSDEAKEFLESLSEFSSDDRGDINTRSLGNKFSKYKDRIENGYILENFGKSQSIGTWRVRKI